MCIVTLKGLWDSFLKYILLNIIKMKRTLLLLIAVISLVSIVVLVLAINPNQSMELNKGWNLVSTYSIESDIFDVRGNSQLLSELEGKGIKAIFFYDKSNNKYIQIYPNHENKETEVNKMFENIEPSQFLNSAFWVYSDKKQVLDFVLHDDSFNIDRSSITAGWNFIGITPEMSGKTIQEITSQCNMEKAYFWNANVRGQSGWSEINQNNNRIDTENIWAGFIIKVSSDCILSTGGDSVTPPTIPN